LPAGIAEAMEAACDREPTDPTQRRFADFADRKRSDAVVSRARGLPPRLAQTLDEAGFRESPVRMVAVGRATKSPSTRNVAAMFPEGERWRSRRDHNLAVGDKVYRTAVLRFWSGGGKATARTLD